MQKARAQGLFISFDPNLRPSLWPSEAVMRDTLNELAFMADLVLPGIGEGEILTGSREPSKIAAFYRENGVKTVIIKTGKYGAYGENGRETIQVPPIRRTGLSIPWGLATALPPGCCRLFMRAFLSGTAYCGAMPSAPSRS